MLNFAVKITGPAGYGIKTTGLVLAKTFLRLGKQVFAYTEYPSLIRGGHNTYQIDISDNPIHSSKEQADIFIFLDKKSFIEEFENIPQAGVIIFDESIKPEELDNYKNLQKKKVRFLACPLVEIAKKNGGELMKNTVALGVLMRVLNLHTEELSPVLKDFFVSLSTENIEVAKTGYAWLDNQIRGDFQAEFKLATINPEKQGSNLLISGNQAAAMGGLAAGCQVYVAYPMTPASEILHFLEAKQKETGVLVHQPEDEIAAIHAAIGASFAGARAAVGTSGGGFALMNEGYSLAAMTETPLVIFEVQRPAPATGNPTWSDQGDLGFVTHAGHGEFARVVIAPGLPEQAFDLTQHAFKLAEKHQTPIIVLMDKHLGESYYTQSADVFDDIEKQPSTIKKGKLKESQELFERYKLTASGVSERTVPGTEFGEYIANSDEHDQFGYSDESKNTRTSQMDKRLKKLQEIKDIIPLPKVYGPKNAKHSLVCWGSTLGAALDTLEYSAKNEINVIHFEYVWPLPHGLDKFLRQFKHLILVEQNKTGQLGALIKESTGIDIKDSILKYNSRPFWREEVEKKIGK